MYTAYVFQGHCPAERMHAESLDEAVSFILHRRERTGAGKFRYILFSDGGDVCHSTICSYGTIGEDRQVTWSPIPTIGGDEDGA